MLSFRTLLLLFVALRLQAVLFLKPGGNLFVGGLDIGFYRDVAALSLDGALPWIGHWSEYPPLFPWLAAGVLWLAAHLPGWPNELTWFQIGLGLFFVAADAGSLALIYAIGRCMAGEAHGKAAAVAWALLFYPLYVTLSWFDSLPVFFVLLGLWLMLRERPVGAGVAVGVGVLVKLFPAILAAVALRVWWPRLPAMARFAAATAATIAAVLVPLFLVSPEMTVASLRVILGRESWLTVWALLEGYTWLGFMPEGADRLRPETARFQPHPTPLSWPLINGVFVAMLLWLLTRRTEWASPRVRIAATGTCLALLLLFSRGHSPQWTVYLLPFFVLLLPGAPGAIWALALQAATLVEWPVAFVLLPDHPGLLVASIVVRTAIYAVAAVLFGSIALGREPAWTGGLTRAVAAAGAVALLAVAVLVVRGVPAQGIHARAAAYVDPLAAPAAGGSAVVATSSELRWQLGAYSRGWPVVDLARERVPSDEAARRTLDDLAAAHGSVWIVADYRHSDAARRGLLESHLVRDAALADERWFDFIRVLGYATEAAGGVEWQSTAARYPEGPAIVGWGVAGGRPSAGGRVRLAVRWESPGLGESEARAFGARKLFLHVVDRTGARVAQKDVELARAAGESPLRSRSFVAYGDVAVDGAAAAGPTRLAVGLYDPANGRRYAFEGADTLEVAGPELR